MVKRQCRPTHPTAAAARAAGDSLPSPGRDVGSLSDNRLSEQERKEPLIILLATGGRHTQGFLDMCVCVCGSGAGVAKPAFTGMGPGG